MTALAGIVGVRPGEGERVGLTVAVGALSAAGLMIGGSAIEAIFFSTSGIDRLPGLYLILGVSMFVATLGFAALVGSLGRGRACLAIPVGLSVLAAAGRIALLGEGAWVPSALWLLQAVAQFLVFLAVWGLAGIVTDTRQAKRFFPLIGAGIVFGYVVGGLSTKPLASLLGTEHLLLVWAGSLVVVVALGVKIVSIGDGWTHRRPRQHPGPIADLRRGMSSVVGSPMMRWMALGALLFSLLFFSLYLPFSGAAAGRFPDPDALAGFFGVFFGLSTGLAFVLSLVVTNRLLARFGVPTVLIVLPVLYVISFGVLTLQDGFVALATARFLQVAWLQGGAVSAIEAVTNTTPADRRDQTRAFLYGGPTQLGTIAAGAIAIVGDGWPAAVRFAIATGCAVVATLAMVGVRRQYHRELVHALREGRPSVFERGPGPNDPFGLAGDDGTAAQAALDALGDPDPRMRRIGAQVVADLDVAHRTDSLLAALRDDDADVRAIAISSLVRTHAAVAVPALVARVGDPDPRVRAAAVRAVGLLEPDRTPAVGAIEPALDDPDALVRTRAAEVIAGHGDVDAAIGPLLAACDDPNPPVRAAAYEGLARVHDRRARDASVRGLGDPDPLVRSAAAASLPDTTETVDLLIRMLPDPSTRDGVLAALTMLHVAQHRTAVHDAAIAMMREALVRRGQAAMFAGIDDAPTRLLGDSLRALADRDARDAVRTVAVLDAGAGTDIAVALDHLALTDPVGRANAIEVLDTIGDREIVRPLLSMWEGQEARSEPTPAALETLADDPDDWIRACVEFVIGHGPSDGGQTMGEIATTLSPMERVVFLRGVSLFAALEPADLLPVASVVQERSFVAGDVVATRGEPGDEMFIVVSGSVAVGAPGGDVPIATRGVGDAIGEMALLTGRPRVADLTATDDVRALTIARPQFEAILRERPEIALAVITVLCERLEESQGGESSGAAPDDD